MEIRKAVLSDKEGVFALLGENHLNTIDPKYKPDGFVTTALSDEQMTDLIEKENGLTIAEDNGKIVAFAMAASWDYWKQWPLFQKMIELLPDITVDGTALTTENSYQYGPVCVDRKYRTSGLFERIFYTSLRSMRERYPYMVTFINQINPRSYKAHTRKAGMKVACSFDFNNNHYWLLTIPTSAERPTPIIRKAVASDTDAIAATYEELLTWEQTHENNSNWALGIYPTRKVPENVIPQGTMYVMEDDTGNIVASMNVNQDQAPEYGEVEWLYKASPEEVQVIHTLCIPPSQKRRGYGHRMLDFVKQQAVYNGCTVIRIDTYAYNEPAKALYTNNDFRISGWGHIVLQGVIPEDQVFLECRL